MEQTPPTIEELVERLAGPVITLIGFVAALIVDWRIAVAVFVMLWGNNITTEQARRRLDAERERRPRAGE